MLLGLGALAHQQTRAWRDTESLFQNALAENPDCLPAEINLTQWYTRQQQYDKAIAHGRHAVELAPNGLPGRKNLAYALKHAGRTREAIAVLQPAIDHHVDDADTWQLFGECLMAEKDWSNAKLAFDGALRCAEADKNAIRALLATVQDRLEAKR